jgi:hypothetical protein
MDATLGLAQVLALAGVWVMTFIQLKTFSHAQRKQYTLLTIMVAIWMSVATIAQLKELWS